MGKMICPSKVNAYEATCSLCATENVVPLSGQLLQHSCSDYIMLSALVLSFTFRQCTSRRFPNSDSGVMDLRFGFRCEEPDGNKSRTLAYQRGAADSLSGVIVVVFACSNRSDHISQV